MREEKATVIILYLSWFDFFLFGFASKFEAWNHLFPDFLECIFVCFFFFSFNFIFYEVLKYWYIFLCKKEKKFLAFLHCASPKTVECYTQCWSAFDTSQSWKWFQNPIEWGFYCLFWQLRSPTQSTDKMPTAPASFSHVTACWEPAPKQNWERK